MRLMRLIVLFDLPTGNKEERKSYTEFRNFLLNDGYTMLQFSVYSRVAALSRDTAETHLRRLKNNLPAVGKVTALLITEAQFENREVLVNTNPLPYPMALDAQMTLGF